MKSNSKETNRIKEPSKFAIKFANTVFMLGILFSVLAVVYAVYRISSFDELVYTSTFYYANLLFALIVAALLGYGLMRLPAKLKVNLSMLFITSCITVYSFEVFLFIKYYPIRHEYLPQERERIAERDDIPFDTRSTLELITDLNESGIDAKLNYFPAVLIKENGILTDNGRIFPFGGISNTVTNLGKEAGYYPIYETDEHGFNNSKGLYEKEVDVVLIGDSFTEGQAVHQNETIGAVLRRNGLSTISFGKSSNGSLINYATFREYAKPLKPKVVLWLYYDNDVWDLRNEINSPFLFKYLNDDDFSQNLISRQTLIDNILNKFLLEKWEIEIQRERINEDIKIDIYKSNAIQILLLLHLRGRLHLTSKEVGSLNENLYIYTIHKKIIKKTLKTTSEWGGRFYFVNLPSYGVYSKGQTDVYRDSIFDFASELNISVINMHKEVFNTHADPLSLFPFRLPHHYNAEGYRLVAEAISKRLKADGIFPLNSKN